MHCKSKTYVAEQNHRKRRQVHYINAVNEDRQKMHKTPRDNDVIQWWTGDAYDSVTK